METSNPTKHWWLLITRGFLYTLLGGSLFLFTDSFTSQSGQLIGGLLLTAGVCGFVYAYTNLRADRNHFWELLRSGFDVGLGIAIFVYSTGGVDDFLGVLGLWAILYAFIQSVQTMYLFMVPGMAPVISFVIKVLYFLNVAIAGGLAYLLLMMPAGFSDSLAMVGLFPIALGVLIMLLAIQQKKQAVSVNKLV